MEFIYVLNPKAAEELMAHGFGYTTSTMNGNLVWIFDYNDELQRFTLSRYSDDQYFISDTMFI